MPINPLFSSVFATLKKALKNMKLIYSLCPILFWGFAIGCATSQNFALSAPLPQLKTESNYFTNNLGEPIKLRGVSLCSLAWHSPLEQIKQVSGVNTGWHPNILRLPVQVREWDRVGGDAYIRARLAPAVKLCRENGVYCIIDWHLIAAWDDPVSDQRLRDFWRKVAPLYANDPNILYEIFNEPTTPKQRTRENWLKWRDKAQSWVDFIRTMAPETILLVGSPHWDQMTSFAAEDPIVGTNIGYVTHVYPNWKPHKWDKLFGDAAAKIPMMITEWGWSSAESSEDTLLFGSADSYGQPLRDYLDARPQIGWTAAWSYDPRCGPAMLGRDKDMGDFVKKWLKDIQRLRTKAVP
jgi:endoglucanase